MPEESDSEFEPKSEDSEETLIRTTTELSQNYRYQAESVHKRLSALLDQMGIEMVSQESIDQKDMRARAEAEQRLKGIKREIHAALGVYSACKLGEQIFCDIAEQEHEPDVAATIALDMLSSREKIRGLFNTVDEIFGQFAVESGAPEVFYVPTHKVVQILKENIKTFTVTP